MWQVPWKKQTQEISGGCHFQSRRLGKCSLSRWHLLKLTPKGPGVSHTKIRGCGWPLMIHQIVLCSIWSWEVKAGWIAHVGIFNSGTPRVGEVLAVVCPYGENFITDVAQNCLHVVIIKSRLTFSQFYYYFKILYRQWPCCGMNGCPPKDVSVS